MLPTKLPVILALAIEPCVTTVPVHAGQDLPPGTLRAIERDLEPCLDKRWLGRWPMREIPRERQTDCGGRDPDRTPDRGDAFTGDVLKTP
jgi:hypothetical protein